MFGDAKHLIDFGRTSFGMEALHWTAVQVSTQSVELIEFIELKVTDRIDALPGNSRRRPLP